MLTSATIAKSIIKPVFKPVGWLCAYPCCFFADGHVVARQSLVIRLHDIAPLFFGDNFNVLFPRICNKQLDHNTKIYYVVIEALTRVDERCAVHIFVEPGEFLVPQCEDAAKNESLDSVRVLDSVCQRQSRPP